jgi:MOSC domain-containing protein YiiM
MQGTVVQINVSRGGLPKRAIAECDVTPLGLAGDDHAHPQIHGGPRKALLLICAEVIDELRAAGYPLYYGALGENLTISGINHRDLRAGLRLRVGQIIIELTTVRGPCATLDVYGPEIKKEIYDKQVKDGDTDSPLWAKSGFYASVGRPGRVRMGDIITVVDQVV